MILYGSKEEIELRCSSCLKDESRLSGFADAAYFPESFDELVQTVRKFRDQKIPYTLSSGRTGISGGAVPQGGALLSLERLDRIIGIEQNDDTGRVHVRVEPGVRLAELEQFISTYKFVDNKKYHFPVDPTETTACLGGMVSLNASGSRSFRNGALRNHISALTVILPDGEILIIRRGDYPLENGMFEFESVHGKAYSLPWNLSRPTDIKNNAGIFFNEAMDLVDLFIGAEGVLGVIAEAEIMLVEAKPEEASFISFFFFRRRCSLICGSGAKNQ
jgi:D-lactate dehydrogenase (cytochrome)